MADKTKFNQILDDINQQIQTIPDQWHEPKSDELEQFKKSSFYHNWYGRFHSLGLYGVLAIPNTTFEEWLWWFHEWAEAFVDDYNKFKQQVYSALKLLNDYLDELKKQVDGNTAQIDKINKQIQEINKQITNLGDDIKNLGDKVNNLTQRITQLEHHNDDLQKRVNDLEDGLGKLLNRLQQQGAWHGGSTVYNGDFNEGQSVASGNINVYGITAGGNYYIKTHVNGDRDGDIVQGLN